ncbi:hypothetical protein [Pseudomonas fluorescens]|uniref:Uncharacterized protein n=1 Tax=Pseudomonas fluorescens TaxID=294 RepID=A0A5E6TKM2_PSEFL|nr:hypothetical protein [Pseudomonas fluorescens]VVM93824.1 hypothetical protein PS655_02957 [Pseudomonas fluorescens]
MKINLIPQGRPETLEVIRLGDTLNINGEDFDFSPIGEGDTLPATAVSSSWFMDKIERVNGVIELTLILPLPSNYSPEQAFPVPLVDVPDGSVAFPQPLPEPMPPAPNATSINGGPDE